MSYITRKKAVKDSFVNVIEELGDSDRVRYSYSLTDSRISGDKDISRKFYSR
jgi:hypothetical protein